MRFAVVLVLPLLLLLQGCVYFHQSSGTANANEIRQHLVLQLHCQALELGKIGRNHFSGTGRNAQGEFTIEVQREVDQLKFHGIYVEPAKGTLSGSASWNKSASGFLGQRKSKVAEDNSVGNP